MDAKELGDFIAALRKENQITQMELAKKLNVTDKAVSRWERGLGFPDINTLESLADALGVSLVELMQSKRNVNNEPISAEKAVELLQDTIQLSKVYNKFSKIVGVMVLAAFAIVAAIVLGVLFTDWDIVIYIVVSIIAGLIAWGIPVWKMTISQKAQTIAAAEISLSCAMIAILFQLINIAHDIHINDVTAVIDTIDGVVRTACIFSVITFLLNIIMVVRSKKKRASN